MALKGFFNRNDLLEMGIDLDGPKCDECGLYKNCHSPKMKHTGKGEKKALIIALAPGAIEDLRGEQLVGDSGQLLRDKLTKKGLDLDQDFYKINAVNCRPHKNNKNIDPTEKQLRCCYPLVKQTIQILKPKVIWLFGEQAVRSFYMDRTTEAPMVISTWRGLCIPDREYNAWVIPMFHPSYLLQKQTDPISESVFDRDLNFAISCLQKESVSFIDIHNKVQAETRFERIHKHLKRICTERPPILSFDYETSGVKPYKQKHKIAAVSACYDSSHSFSFPFQYRNMWSNNQLDILHTLWKQILRDPKIKKCAHGLNFEDLWSRHKIGIDMNGKHWCTKLAAHILDNRKGYSGLKFQGRLKWGLENWGAEVEQFLKSSDNEGFNRVEEAPLEKLLIYNGIDSLIEHWLVEKQKEEFSQTPSLLPAFYFFFNSQYMLTNAQDNGINMDIPYYKKKRIELQREIEEKERIIKNSEEFKEFERLKRKPMNMDSSADLRILFFDILKLDSIKLTETELESVDEASLEELNSPIAKSIIEVRKIKKIRNTYMAQFVREIGEDGKLHPFFPLHPVVSYRGCIAKGTLVYVVRDFIEFSKGVPIEAVKKGDFVYCYDNELKPTIRKVLWAGKTGHKKVVRIHWYNKKRKDYIDVTPDHRILLQNGTKVKAENLQKGDKLLAIYRHQNKNDYAYLNTTGEKKIKEHVFIATSFIRSLQKGEIVHHKNGIKRDNTPSNLEIITDTQHRIFNNKLRIGEAQKQRNNYNLSRFQILKILAKNKGNQTKGSYTFWVLQNYCNKYNLDWKIIKLRYDKNGKYISRRRLSRLHLEKGIEGCRKELGHNYYRLQQLYMFYNIEFKRRWGNQAGSFVPHNHKVYLIEYPSSEVDVYNLEVEEFHNYIAGEISVMNSSTQPNLQNIPVRNEEAKKLTRSGIIPSPGNILLDWDYGSQEVRIAACYTKDPVLIAYINDPKTDMHRDEAQTIFCLSPENVTKDLRYFAKNGFVFPQFYGSYWGACAKNLFSECMELKTAEGQLIGDHLQSVGIIKSGNTAYKDFENHVREVETEFWKKFKVFRQCQDGWVDDFIKKGYIEMFQGFKCSGYLNKNRIINYRIQGTAFHCMLYTLMEVEKRIKKGKWKTKIIGEIHDSGIYDTPPEEEQHIINATNYYATEKIREHFPWLIVPLSIEWSKTEVNGSWYSKKEIK